MNIGIDCDGVQFNFCKAYSRVIRDLFSMEYPLIEDDATEVPAWDWADWHPAGKERLDKAWSHIHKIENFWEHEDVLNPEQVEYMVNSFNNNLNITPYFITVRLETKGNPIVRQTINSLRKLGWKDPQVIVTTQKGALAKALDLKVFIDDRAENCAEVAMMSPDTKVYVLDKLYNRILQDKYFKITRVTTLEPFVDYVVDSARMRIS